MATPEAIARHNAQLKPLSTPKRRSPQKPRFAAPDRPEQSLALIPRDRPKTGIPQENRQADWSLNYGIDDILEQEREAAFQMGKLHKAQAAGSQRRTTEWGPYQMGVGGVRLEKPIIDVRARGVRFLGHVTPSGRDVPLFHPIAKSEAIKRMGLGTSSYRTYWPKALWNTTLAEFAADYLRGMKAYRAPKAKAAAPRQAEEWKEEIPADFSIDF